MNDPVYKFRDALAQAELVVGDIIADGEIHRCGTVGKEQGSDGAYLLHLDNKPSGWWKNHRTGDSGTWTYSNGSCWHPRQQDILKNKLALEASEKKEQIGQRHTEAMQKAEYILSVSAPAKNNNPYLKKKSILSYGEIRGGKSDSLILPVKDVSGKLLGLQFIFKDGKKRFLRGSKTSGGFFVIPAHKKANGDLYIAEGYATGATIHAATNATVLVAFNAGNLISVARLAREKYPERMIIICADDDREVEGNPGISKATEAAKAIKAKLAVPSFNDPTGRTDINDLHLAEGIEAVRACLTKATAPKRDVKEVEPPTPVPFDELPPPVEPNIVPEPLQTICREVSNAIQVPFELALANALGGVAVAVQRKIKVLAWPGYAEPLCIYILCPLPPGERKSSTVKEFKRPLLEWQMTQGRELSESIRSAESERKTREKVIEQKRNAAGKIKSPEGLKEAIKEISEMEKTIPTLPVASRLLADDFTPEALVPLMELHEQRIGVLEAEGGLFDILAGLYSKGVPNLDAVLKCWSGEACQIDRRSREPVFLNDPHLTMVISPQPEVVLGLTRKPGFRGRGLLGRFLFLWPKSLLGERVVRSGPGKLDHSLRWT
ncbi:MAG: DUF3987 domain-containing protein [Desulfovibrionaceae bacterium]